MTSDQPSTVVSSTVNSIENSTIKENEDSDSSAKSTNTNDHIHNHTFDQLQTHTTSRRSPSHISKQVHKSLYRKFLRYNTISLSSLLIFVVVFFGGIHRYTHVLASALCIMLIYTLLYSVHKSSGSRNAHIIPIFNIWLMPAWISALLALLSLIPIPIAWSATLNTHYQILWSHLQNLGIELHYAPLSLSPAHTIHWLTLHLLFIIIAYLSYYVHGHRIKLIYTLISVGPLLCFIGIIHQLLGVSSIYGVYTSLDRHQLNGFFTSIINQNTAGSLMMMSGLLTLAIGYSRLEKKKSHFFYMLLFIINGWGIYQCQARFSFLLYILFTAVITWQSQVKASYKYIYSGLISTGCMIFIYTMGDSLLQHLHIASSLLTSSGGESAQQITQWQNAIQEYPRFSTWKDSLAYWNDFYWWGSGRGSFGEVFTGYQTFLTRGWVSHAENIVIATAVEGGLFSIVSSIIMPIGLWIYWWYRSEGEAHIVAVGIYWTLAALLIHQCCDFGFQTFSFGVCCAILWGMLWSYLPLYQKKSKSSKLTKSDHAQQINDQLSNLYTPESYPSYPLRSSSSRRSSKINVYLIHLVLISVFALSSIYIYAYQYKLRLVFEDHSKQIEHYDSRSSSLTQSSASSPQKPSSITMQIKEMQEIKDIQVSQSLMLNDLDWKSNIRWHPHSIHLLSSWIQLLEISDPQILSWIRMMKFLMPMYGGSYRWEARYLQNTLDPVFASSSYYQALIKAPWTRKKIYKEIQAHMPIMSWYSSIPQFMWYDFWQWYSKQFTHHTTSTTLTTLPLNQAFASEKMKDMSLYIWAKYCKSDQLIKSLSYLTQIEKDDSKQSLQFPTIIPQHMQNDLYADQVFVQSILLRCQGRDQEGQHLLQNSFKKLNDKPLHKQKHRLKKFF